MYAKDGKVSLVKGYPEHDKMMDQRSDLDAISSFLEHLEELELVVAEPDKLTLKLYPTWRTNETLLAGWAGIDTAEFLAEKDRMLHAIRIKNAIREAQL